MGMLPPQRERNSPLKTIQNLCKSYIWKAALSKWRTTLLMWKSRWTSGMCSNNACSFHSALSQNQHLNQLKTLQPTCHSSLREGFGNCILKFYLVPITVVTKHCTKLSTTKPQRSTLLHYSLAVSLVFTESAQTSAPACWIQVFLTMQSQYRLWLLFRGLI